MKVVDPDSGEELAAGKSGMIWVKGPNVMQGYLGDAVPDPKKGERLIVLL